MGCFLSILLLLLGVLFTEAPPAPRPHPGGSVQTSMNCPSGSVLVGKECVTTETLPPSFVCPPGTRDVNGECSTFINAARVCPRGFTRGPQDTCTATHPIPPIFSCPEGELTGNQCRIVTELPVICPAGTQMRDGTCIRLTPVEKLCPVGFSLHGKECSKVISIGAQPLCPPDFEVAPTGICTKLIRRPPFCPHGFILKDLLCLKFHPQIPAPCPEGTVAVNDRCRFVQTLPPRPACPPGTELLGDQCLREILVPPTCPPATRRGPTGQCELPVARVPACDNSEELVGNQCVKRTYFVPDLVCPPSHTLHEGLCKNVQTVPPLLKCPTGVLKGQECAVVSSTTPLLSCPPGFSLTKGVRCTQQVPYDCSKEVTTTECDMPAFVGKLSQARPNYKVKGIPPVLSRPALSSKKEPLLFPSGDTGANAPVSQPPSYGPPVPVSAPPFATLSKSTPRIETPNCAPVTRLVPQTCSKEEEKPTISTCPFGTVTQGKECIVTTLSPPILTCLTGQLDKATELCTTISVIPASTVCPIGQLQEDRNCLKVDSRPAPSVCPEGALDSGVDCVRVEPEMIHPNQIVRQAPQKVCDVGVLQGKACIEEQFVPRGLVCPAGTEDQGDQCITTTSPVEPPPNKVTQPAKFVCPPGNVLVGDQCTHREAVPNDYTCRGGILEGNRCVFSTAPEVPPAQVRERAADIVCPAGYTLQGKECLTTTVQPATLVCPTGTALYGKGSEECFRRHPREPVCPPGTRMSPTGCVKKTYAPPTVTEVRVYTKGGR